MCDGGSLGGWLADRSKAVILVYFLLYVNLSGWFMSYFVFCC